MKETMPVSVNPYLELTSANDSSIQEFWVNNPSSQVNLIYPDNLGWFSNAFLKNLYCIHKVASLPGQPPVIDDPSKSPAQNEVAAINALWSVPRIQIEIYQGFPGSSDWLWRGSASLTNQVPFPFTTDDYLGYFTNNLGYEFSHGSKLGFAVKDAGQGLLKVGDKVSIVAGIVCECQIRVS